MKYFGFSIVVFPEAKSYSAWCPELDVASQGDTLNDAVKHLKEAMELHLECLSSSELQEIKRRQGTKLITTLMLPIPH
ncbi:MAG: type II toxin-antitoxin system HicB family antitoxin [Candidatus Micrarchaeota archaeon]